MGVVSDSVHERNVMVEEQLGVQLEMYPADGDVHPARKGGGFNRNYCMEKEYER